MGVIRSLFPGGFPPPEPEPTGRWRHAVLAALVLASILVVLYWPAVDFRLLSFDDQYYTRENSLISGGLRGPNVVRALTRLPSENLFIPITHLSLMADVELFGMAPRGFHLTNILLFAIDIALLLLVLWRLTGSLWKSALAAAFVALHPLRVESVAWVTERKGLLAVFFLLLTVACHLRFVRSGRRAWYVALLLCAAIGMLAKPILVTLPVLLLLLDFWPLGRFRQDREGRTCPSFPRRTLALVIEKIPLLACSAAVTLTTLYLQQKMSFHENVSLASRLEHSFTSDLFYLYQTMWPKELIFRFFDTPWARFSGTLLPALLGVAIITAIVVRFGGRKPYVAFGWSWYLLALLPSSGFFPAGIQWISDRFTFIPHIGLAVAVVWLACDLASRRWRPILLGLAALALLLLAALTRQHLFDWKDGATVFGRGAEYSRDDPRYINTYACELMDMGDYPHAKEQIERILGIAMDPQVGIDIQLTYLAILERTAGLDNAIAQARLFLSRDPNFWKTRLNLADYLLAQARYSEAVPEYRRVLAVERMNPTIRAHALEGLGLALAATGQPDEALAAYAKGILEDPASSSLPYNLACLLADRGRPEEARAQFEEALRRDPANPVIRLKLADLLLASGDTGDAMPHLREVAVAAQGKAESLAAQGRILDAAGDHAQARTLYENALSLPAILPETLEDLRRRLAARH
jgi:tetratricopeptide (TPR) repeat protein